MTLPEYLDARKSQALCVTIPEQSARHSRSR
jgi:hypothetical protein